MAGYLFSFGDEDALFDSMSRGRYSTLMKAKWGPAHLPTLGDYATMRQGDRVYFFAKRMVYGIGVITDRVQGCTVLENREGVTGRAMLGIADENETCVLRGYEAAIRQVFAEPGFQTEYREESGWAAAQPPDSGSRTRFRANDGLT